MPVSMNNNVSQTVSAQKVSKPNQEPKKTEKASMSTGVKVAIGTGLAALAAVGIYFAMRGKVKTSGVEKEVKNAINETINSNDTIKNLNPFKKAGLTSKKGIVSNADGSLYTGILEHEGKNGAKLSLEYKDGKIIKSTKTNDGKLIFEKKYDRTGDEFLDIEYNVTGNDGALRQESKTLIYKNSNITQIQKQYADGHYVKYKMDSQRANPVWHSEKLPDGTSRSWYKNGQMSYEELPDGTSHYWHRNGQIAVAHPSPGETCYWYDNGQIACKEIENAQTFLWNENGKLIPQDEKFSDKRYEIITNIIDRCTK